MPAADSGPPPNSEQPGSDAPQAAKRKSFWDTLPGIATKIVAAVTALAGLVSGIEKSWSTFQKWLAPGPTVANVEVATKNFKVMPFSLKNSLASQEFLYWFHIRVNNKSSQLVNLKVTFRVREGPAGGGREAEFTVPARGLLSEKVNPAFELFNYDAAAHLDVSWLITDKPAERTLHSGTTTFQLLPRNMVAWDLTTPEGHPVPQDFLLASLAAWTLTPAAPIRERAAQLLKAVDRGLEPERFSRQWFEQCYRKLLADPQGLKITPRTWSRFPPRGRQTIRIPGEVLEQRLADPLEAALLLGALASSVASHLNIRLAMLAAAESDQAPERPGVLLAWSTAGNDFWHGLDITHASTLSFAENESRTTSRVAELMRQNPELLRQLEEKGTFLKAGAPVVALEFARAAEHFSIWGLP